MNFEEIYGASNYQTYPDGRHTNVYYEYISIPDKLVEKYSKSVFENFPKEYHITTCFKPDYDLSEYYGSLFHFKVIAYGVSEKAEAVKIELLDKPEWLYNLKDLLHVTLSFKEKAVDSNYITDWEPVDDEVVYEGTFEGKNFKKVAETQETMFSIVFNESQETKNVEYATTRTCELDNFSTNASTGNGIITSRLTGWQKWVRSRNPEPEKFHNKFGDAEKNGIYYSHCVPCIIEGN